MVLGLACLCCIKRWVKKPSNRTAKLDALFISALPSASPDAPPPAPSAPDMSSDTNRYRRHGRVRDKWKESEDGAPHLRQSDTSSPRFAQQIGDESRAAADRDSRTSPGGLF